MMILVCNVGSTSLKFKLYDMPDTTVLAEGKVERVRSLDDAIFYYANPAKNFEESLEGQSIPDYTRGIEMFLGYLLDADHGVLTKVEQLERVGFKTVLSKNFYGIHELTEEVLQGMEDYLIVAPAHNGPYLEAIRQFKKIVPKSMLVGAFETAFHMTIPKHRRIFSTPYDWHEEYGIMRMGYHGASHGYIADKIGELEGPGRKVISCHLGGSCSLCAIDDGKSMDNSFGFSLQNGVLHANRSGDIDPYIIPFMMDMGLSMEEVLQGLAKNGGLLGISGVSNDLRHVETAAAEGNERAKLAIDIFCHDIIRYIGSYYAELGGLDDLVFTGGIGENGDAVRKQVCQAVSHFGIVLDEAKNQERSKEARVISKADSPVKIWVIPANEELGIAKKTYEYA